MGWKTLLLWAKTIVKESDKFEEEEKEEEEKGERKKTFWPSGDFLVQYFCDTFYHHWLCCSS